MQSYRETQTKLQTAASTIWHRCLTDRSQNLRMHLLFFSSTELIATFLPVTRDVTFPLHLAISARHDRWTDVQEHSDYRIRFPAALSIARAVAIPPASRASREIQVTMKHWIVPSNMSSCVKSGMSLPSRCRAK